MDRSIQKRKTYDGAFKATVVLEYMGRNSDLTELATKYQLHPNQIKNWKSLFLKRANLILEDKRQHRRAASSHP